MTKADIWDEFFNDPLLKSIIEEAQEVDSDSDPEMEGGDDMAVDAPAEDAPQGAPAEGEMDIDQLIADFQGGGLSQDDLIKMYQSGKISKDDIERIIQAGEGAEEPQSEEELLGQQISQTNDMFVKFALYDKISDLTEKLAYFKENFDDIQSDTYSRVLQLSEFLNILSSLIFSIETPVSYQMYGSILLQLTELFDEYNKGQRVEDAQENLEDQQIADEKQARGELDLNAHSEDVDAKTEDNNAINMRDLEPKTPIGKSD